MTEQVITEAPGGVDRQLLSLDGEVLTSNCESDKELESFLFGAVIEESDSIKTKNAEYLESTEEHLITNTENKGEGENILPFVISKKPGSIELLEHLSASNDNVSDDIVNEQPKLIHSNKRNKEKSVAWIDPDDEEVRVNIDENRKRKLKAKHNEKEVSGTTYQKRLKTQYEKILPAPVWADVDDVIEDDGQIEGDDDDLGKLNSNLLDKQNFLPKSILKIHREKNLNKQNECRSSITGLEFHPSLKIAFTTSMDNRLCLFQVDGRDNPKLQGIFLEHFPIANAHFGNEGQKIYMSSRTNYFYCYDVQGGGIHKAYMRDKKERVLEKFEMSPDGRTMAFFGVNGYIHLVSTKSCTCMFSLKMNGKLNSLAFSNDSSTIYSAGSDGEVYVWDVRTRKCRQRFVDDGSIGTSALSCAPNGRFLAVGSSSGVVNVYEQSNLNVTYPKPTKILMNLTSGVERAQFNSSSEILSYYSGDVRNGLKLVHFPSLTYFSNWPPRELTLGNITSIGFSPMSGYLGIGNKAGKALLFRLPHYPDV